VAEAEIGERDRAGRIAMARSISRTAQVCTEVSGKASRLSLRDGRGYHSVLARLGQPYIAAELCHARVRVHRTSDLPPEKHPTRLRIDPDEISRVQPEHTPARADAHDR